MTGRIKIFSVKTGNGIIESENGRDFSFQIADVLAFDRIGLKQGKVVGFVEMEHSPTRAFDVFICTGVADHFVPTRSKAGDDLRYTGFRYENGLRVYSFEARVVGEETRRYLVETQVDVLLDHKISLQETPALCLGFLLRRMQLDSFPFDQKVNRISIKEKDILEYVSERPTPKPRAHVRPGRGIRKANSSEGSDEIRDSLAGAGD